MLDFSPSNDVNVGKKLHTGANCYNIFLPPLQHFIQAIVIELQKPNLTIEMIRNFFKIAMRNLVKQGGYSIINITGLAIGLAASLLILMWIQHELSYDRFYTDSDQIYRVEMDQYYGAEPYHVNVTPVPSAPVWKSRIPEIIDICRVNRLPRVLFERGDTRLFESQLMAADSTFFRIFDFKFLYGDPETALVTPHSIVLTEELARKYFGDENPLGQGITLERQMEFIVTGVLEKVPDNTTLQFDAVIPFRFLYEIGVVTDNWNNNSILTFAKMQPVIDRAAVGRKITEITMEYKSAAASQSRLEFMINPITRVHLHGYFGYASPMGAMIYIYIFMGIAIFVLVIASINFVNLSTARSAKRGREIGVKKVSGALRTNMVVQFLLESILQVFIALFFALIIVGLLIGVFNGITGKEFSVSDIFSPQFISGFIAIAVVAGLVAGIYPALFLSSFKPVLVLKGNAGGTSGSGRLRKILVVIQFVLSIFLAVCGFVIYNQTTYMRNIDMGYNRENLVRISALDNVKEQYYTLKAELERNPLIQSVSGSMINPTYIGSNSSGVDWEGKDPDQRALLGLNGVDYGFVETMEYTILRGRSFSEDYPADMVRDTTGNFIVNEEAVRMMGVEDPVGMRFSFLGVNGTIVGVMKNFYFKPASEVIEPMAFFCAPLSRINEIMVRLAPGNQKEALAALEETWQKVIPEYPLDYTFVEEEVENMYRAETRMGDLFKYFTILAVLIAALGLYGLSSYIAEQRTREIGVRKIMGSSVPEIVMLFAKEFALLVIIAAAVGLPLAWLYLRDWLQGFPYRAGLNPLVFIIVGAGALLLALLTVSYQSYRAALTNPADSIRAE